MIDRQLSARNPRVRQLAKLVSSRKARRDENLLVVDGPRALATFLDAGGEVLSVFTDDSSRLAATIVESGSDIWEVERCELDKLSDSASPQGIMAIGQQRVVSLETAVQHDRIVVLDGIQDPGNVGAVIRVAAACGVEAVVACTGTADPTAPRAVRASAGSIAMIDLVLGGDVMDVVATAQLAGVRTIATAMVGTVSLDQLRADVVSDRPGPPRARAALAIILGSEGSGLPPGVLDAVDDTLALSMRAPVESLNVAVTAGIVLHSLMGSLDT